MSKVEIGTVLFLSFVAVWVYVATRMFGEPKPRRIRMSYQTLGVTLASIKMLRK